MQPCRQLAKMPLYGFVATSIGQRTHRQTVCNRPGEIYRTSRQANINCDATTLKELIIEGHRVLAKMPPKSALTLNDVTGTYFDQESVRLLKETVVANDPYVKRGAVIGISGLQSLIYSAVQAFSRRKIPTFSTKEEALDWLVKD
jgi:hypothetical protein